MRKGILLSLLIILLGFGSWTANRKRNANSWSVALGKKVLLCSYKNKEGDMARVSLSTIKSYDSLYVGEYICGGDGEKWNTTLTIKDDKDNILKQCINKHQTGAWVKLRFYDIPASNEFSSGKVLYLYFKFSFDSDTPTTYDNTTLLGRLKLE